MPPSNGSLSYQRSLTDEFNEDRPKSVVPENIEGVRKLMMQDRHLTYHEIESTVDFSITRITKILHNHLFVKNICARWIPHNLKIIQKKENKPFWY